MANDSERGFDGVSCIKCGEANVVRVDLFDLNFHCSSCDEDFKDEDVRSFVDGWRKVLAWVDAAPNFSRVP